MDQGGKPRLAAETVLRGDGDISERRVRPEPIRERVLAAAGESTAVEVDRRHVFLAARRGAVNIQLQIHVAALAEDDVLFNGHSWLRRLLTLSHPDTERRQGHSRQRRSEKTASRHLVRHCRLPRGTTTSS